MKRQKRILMLMALGLSMLLIPGCSDKNERKIKLADRPMTALMQDEIESIELAAAQKIKVALLNFQNQNKQQAVDWLVGGINQKLTRELARSQQLNLNPSLFVQDVLDSLNLSLKDLDSDRNSSTVASKVNADVLVLGDFYFDQEALHVDMQLRGADGHIIQEFSRESQQADTLAALNDIVGSMAIDIRRELEEPEKGSDGEVLHASASTTSIDALKLYIKGRKKIEQFYLQDAVPLLEKAVQLDTAFASAYLSLGHALMGLGLSDQARPMFDKAMEHSIHLSERERIPIEASRALIDGEYYKAIELYNHYIELYPEDADAHYELGNYYFSIVHNYPKAIEKYETTVELNPKHKLAHNQLAYAYAYIGELDHAFNILDKYAELAPNEPNPLDSYGEILQREGRLKDAIQKFQKALHVDANFWPSRVHLATAYQDLGNTRRAERMLRDILQDSLYQRYWDSTVRSLAYNAIVEGDLNKAENEMRSALQEDPDNWNLKMSLLYVRPEVQEYQDYLVELLAEQVELAHKDSLQHGMLLDTVSRALYFGLGLDLVDELLDNAIERTNDPILYQSAIAYKLILDFRSGRSTEETQKLYARSTDPQTFQYAGPASWNAYWRFYFDALRIASGNGVPISDWVEGFYTFSQKSQNHHFEINSAIAVAAAKFLADDTTAARRMINNVGIPCEGDWKFVGPFTLDDGFHQKFWPEKVSIDKWPSREKYTRSIFQGRDDLFDGYINLNDLTPSRVNQAVYALLQIDSKDYQVAQIRFGMSGRLKVWLNGQSVMIKNVRGDAIIDRYIATVKLHLGTNYLLVRVDNAIGDLGFYFRMTNLAGEGDILLDFESPSLIAHVEDD